jgi:hypothetical protein
MTDRDSTKHSARLDDELKKEVGSLTHGSPAESRKEEWREQEGAGDEEREPSSRTSDPSALGPDNKTARALAGAERPAPGPGGDVRDRVRRVEGARRRDRARRRPPRPPFRGRRVMSSEPGLDRHEWTTEFAQLEEGMRDDPFDALPVLTELVERMLAERGFELQPRFDEGGIVHEFADAKAISAQGPDADPGDVALALQKLVGVYDFLDEERRAP